LEFNTRKPLEAIMRDRDFIEFLEAIRIACTPANPAQQASTLAQAIAGVVASQWTLTTFHERLRTYEKLHKELEALGIPTVGIIKVAEVTRALHRGSFQSFLDHLTVTESTMAASGQAVVGRDYQEFTQMLLYYVAERLSSGAPSSQRGPAAKEGGAATTPAPPQSTARSARDAQPTSKTAAQSESRMCYACGKYGHLAAQCTEAVRKRSNGYGKDHSPKPSGGDGVKKGGRQAGGKRSGDQQGRRSPSPTNGRQAASNTGGGGRDAGRASSPAGGPRPGASSRPWVSRPPMTTQPFVPPADGSAPLQSALKKPGQARGLTGWTIVGDARSLRGGKFPGFLPLRDAPDTSLSTASDDSSSALSVASAEMDSEPVAEAVGALASAADDISAIGVDDVVAASEHPCGQLYSTAVEEQVFDPSASRGSVDLRQDTTRDIGQVLAGDRPARPVHPPLFARDSSAPAQDLDALTALVQFDDLLMMDFVSHKASALSTAAHLVDLNETIVAGFGMRANFLADEQKSIRTMDRDIAALADQPSTDIRLVRLVARHRASTKAEISLQTMVSRCLLVYDFELVASLHCHLARQMTKLEALSPRGLGRDHLLCPTETRLLDEASHRCGLDKLIAHLDMQVTACFAGAFATKAQLEFATELCISLAQLSQLNVSPACFAVETRAPAGRTALRSPADDLRGDQERGPAKRQALASEPAASAPRPRPSSFVPVHQFPVPVARIVGPRASHDGGLLYGDGTIRIQAPIPGGIYTTPPAALSRESTLSAGSPTYVHAFRRQSFRPPGQRLRMAAHAVAAATWACSTTPTSAAARTSWSWILVLRPTL
jgi:hypothetical protein